MLENDLKVKTSVPIDTKAQKHRLPEEKRTNFIENLAISNKNTTSFGNYYTNEPNH